MAIRRVAIVFDNKVRPDTTGVYCRRALGQIAEIEHFLPTELSRIPRDGFDLYLHVDDGLAYELPGDLRPSAWWSIDTHLSFDDYLPRARGYDFVFCAQRDGADGFRVAGVRSACWLPLACDPEFHRRHEVRKLYDVCFVGHVFPGPRAELVELLRRRFARSFVGERYFEDMARTYSQSRAVFNRSIRNDVNMRVFEAVACGSLLLTNDLSGNGQDDLFEDGVHLATYRDADELLDKLAYYLRRPRVREKVAAAGREEALAWHTYRHRMEVVLRDVEASLATRASVPAAVPSAVAPVPQAPAELADLVPESASAVLHLGCGNGGLGAALKARRPVTVWGVEADPPAVERARTRLDHVVASDPERLDGAFADGYFDAVVTGDLAAWRDPLEVLRRARAWLKPGGRLGLRVANARHHGVVRALLDGGCAYAGVLDPACPRLFTRRELEKVLWRAGFSLPAVHVVPGENYDEWKAWGRPGEVAAGPLRISGLPTTEAEEFYASAFLASAEPGALPEPGLTSIVVVTHNQLAWTRLCLESVRRLTDEPYEFILVDNGSTDGTPEFLASIPGARGITNPENRGFPAAANQGIRVSSGRQVLLLNNDTVLTTGWLRRLLTALHSDPRIGLAGPCSNFVSGPQQVAVAYESLEGLDGFAWDFGKQHDGRVEDVDRLVGFCLLIRREVIGKVGLLDERFGVGCFEDDDYTLRALSAGYRAVIARDAFVHHDGGRTFRGAGVDFAALMEKNRRLFEEKWRTEPTPSVTAPAAGLAGSAPPASFGVRPAATGGLLIQPARPLLSLCMIVRDNARTIGPCLESIRPWVDEMVVVDTGSRDETPRLAEALGARVYHFPWCDDFSAARNESLRHARGRWIFWMDSDDTINADCGRRLRELAARDADPSLLGYVIQVHCPGAGEDGLWDITVVDHVKLFRNRPGMRFDGRIHEQILPAIRAAGGEVSFTDLFVVHSGYDHSPDGQKKKLERDLRLLHLELAERPEHPFTLFNLGMTHADVGEFDVAAGYLRRSIAAAGPGESHLRKAHALLIHCLAQTGRSEDAWGACEKSLTLFPEDAELRFRRAGLLQEAGRLAEAADGYRDLLGPQRERYFTSVDRGITGFKARQSLALVYQDQGDWAAAEAEWRKVTEEAPGYRPGWRGLGDALLHSGRLAEALELANRLSADVRLKAEGHLLRGRALTLGGRLEEARAELERAVAERPGDADMAHTFCRFLFEHAEPGEAEATLVALVRREPNDGSAWHNLGTVYLRLGRPAEAEVAYRESLRLRPAHALTHLQLGHALAALGRAEDAAACWREAQPLAPEDAKASEALSAAEAAKRPERGPRLRRLTAAGREVDVVFATRGPVDEAILRDVWERDVYGAASVSPPPKVVVDVGGHIGAFALLARTLWPDARVIACEADPDNFALLCRNLGSCPGVEGVEAAVVGTESAEVDFHSVPDKVGANSGGGSCVRAEPGARTIRVPAVSAAALWRLKGLSSCDFLKLDCEGCEADVLESLAEAGHLARVLQIAGEWHSADDEAGSGDAVRRRLAAVLRRTHDLTFHAAPPGREGHFTAVRRARRSARPPAARVSRGRR